MNFKQLLVLVIVCFASGQALDCYQCQGEQKECKDIDKDKNITVVVTCEDLSYISIYPRTFLPSLLKPVADSVDVKSDSYACASFQKPNEDGSIWYYRSCVKHDKEEVKKECTDLKASCDLCHDNKCNSSYMIVPSMILSAMIVLIAKLICL